MLYDIDDVIEFGKYKELGYTVRDIVEQDPDYLRYLIENSDNIAFTEEVEELL